MQCVCVSIDKFLGFSFHFPNSFADSSGGADICHNPIHSYGIRLGKTRNLPNEIRTYSVQSKYELCCTYLYHLELSRRCVMRKWLNWNQTNSILFFFSSQSIRTDRRKWACANVLSQSSANQLNCHLHTRKERREWSERAREAHRAASASIKCSYRFELRNGSFYSTCVTKEWNSISFFSATTKAAANAAKPECVQKYWSVVPANNVCACDKP